MTTTTSHLVNAAIGHRQVPSKGTLATQALILDFDLAKHILHIRGLTRSKIISGVSYQANYLSADTAV